MEIGEQKIQELCKLFNSIVFFTDTGTIVSFKFPKDLEAKGIGVFFIENEIKGHLKIVYKEDFLIATISSEKNIKVITFVPDGKDYSRNLLSWDIPGQEPIDVINRLTSRVRFLN